MENRESITASPMERIGRNGSSVQKPMEQNRPIRQMHFGASEVKDDTVP